MDRAELQRRLAERFDPSDEALRIVTRQARDLADSGLVESDFGYELTAADVLGHLDDAPETDLIAAWNWWIDSLAVTHVGYRQFRVRVDPAADLDDEPPR